MLLSDSQFLQVPIVSLLSIASAVFFGLLSWLITSRVKSMEDNLKKNTNDIAETNQKLNEVNLEILKEMNKITVDLEKFKKP